MINSDAFSTFRHIKCVCNLPTQHIVITMPYKSMTYWGAVLFSSIIKTRTVQFAVK